MENVNLIISMIPTISQMPSGWIDIAISACLGLSVVLFIVGAFSHGGTIHLSPQRAAAIATGHDDRKTLFEKTLTRPLLWLLLTISCRLNMPNYKRKLRKTLVAAGSPNFYTPEEYIALSMLTGVCLGGVIGIFYWVINAEVTFFGTFIGFIIGTGLTLYNIHSTSAERVSLISKRIPYSLDLIALAMGAGATFVESVKTIVEEEAKDPFSAELKALLAEIELGTTRREALLNLSSRIPLEALHSIVASVIQAEELGTPVSKVLHDQATLLRLRRSVRAETAAAKASVRILVPCLLLVMAVVLAVFGPAIIRLLQGGLI